MSGEHETHGLTPLLQQTHSLISDLSDEVRTIDSEQRAQGKQLATIEANQKTNEKRLDLQGGDIEKLKESRQSSEDHEASRANRSDEPVKVVPVWVWVLLVFLVIVAVLQVTFASIITGRDGSDLIPVSIP